MGRMLGYHDMDELDRPELNKCPDCECYFATDECPLCGKICPEEMRAGNRAPVKHQKRKNTSGRVQFLPWYHTWWGILLMLWFFFPAGIVLFFTSPYSKKLKIIVCSVVAVIALLGVLSVALSMWTPSLVNDKISKDEYISLCQTMAVDDFYRAGDNIAGQYITMQLVVADRFSDWYTSYDDEPALYYLCYDKAQPDTKILVRSCLVGDDLNLKVGDQIMAFGESGGQVTVAKNQNTNITLPCLYMAYVEMAQD